MRLTLWLLTVLGMVWACTFPAAATCYQGGTMTYGDIDSIGLRDCVAVSSESRCFGVRLFEGNAGVGGTYVGVYGSPRLGRFAHDPTAGDVTRFIAMKQLLERARIIEDPPRERLRHGSSFVVLIDGRHAEIVVGRCSTITTYRIANTEFGHDVLSTDPRWEILVNALGVATDGFAWKRETAPSQQADFYAIYSLGKPFIMTPPK